MTMRFLVVAIILALFLNPALAADAADTVPAWLTGVVGMLFNALGLGGGGVLATVVTGILWHLWSFAKAKASGASTGNLLQTVEQGIFSAIGKDPPLKGEELTMPHLDNIVTSVKTQLGTSAPDSDVIRDLAHAAFGKILVNLHGSIKPPTA